MKITLRKAVLEDSKMVLDWRNESTTIPWMGTTRSLSFDEHNNWFTNVIFDPNCLFFIIELDSKPVGQIRFHIDYNNNNFARVSINITQKMHGKGIASIAFSKGNIFVKDIGFASKIFAHVRYDNIGSIKAMENAGYEKTGSIEKDGVKHLVMEYTVNIES